MSEYHSFNTFKFHKRNIETLFSYNPNGKLLIFIHGFQLVGNNPSSPWNHFMSYLADYKEFHNCDIIFYGYDSRIDVSESSLTFKEFIEEIVTHSAEYIRKYKYAYRARSIENISYDRIYIIAHSLGALITRCALNILHKSDYLLANKCKLILFAPAHNGENTVDFYKAVLSDMNMYTIARYLEYRYKCLKDLKPDSDIIRDLKNEISFLLHKGIRTFTIAEKTVISRLDYVVLNSQYLDDKKPQIRMDKKHTKINKTERNYLDPIKIIKETI